MGIMKPSGGQKKGSVPGHSLGAPEKTIAAKPSALERGPDITKNDGFVSDAEKGTAANCGS